MVMRSFAFQQDIPMSVWNVFKEHEKIRGDLYPLEVLASVKKGDIVVGEPFNLAAYIRKVSENKSLEYSREVNRLVGIVDSVAEDSEAEGVTEDIVTGYVEQVDFAEEIADKDEVRFAVNQINNMSREIMIFHKLDIKHCVKQALRGIPDSVACLKNLVVENPTIGEYLKIVLGSGVEFNTLFPQ